MKNMVEDRYASLCKSFDADDQYKVHAAKYRIDSIKRIMRRIEEEGHCGEVLLEFLASHAFGIVKVSCENKKEVTRDAIDKEMQKR